MDNSNLYAFFEAVFKGCADEVVFEVPGIEDISYGELEWLVSKTANALRGLGIGAQHRVVTQTGKSIATVSLYLATIKIGAVYCPLNTAYTRSEIAGFLEDCAPSLFICSWSASDATWELGDDFPDLQCLTLLDDGSGSFADLVSTQSNFCETALVGGDDVAAIVYTSGTTGPSKGAMLTHNNLVSNAQTLVTLWGFEDGDVLLHALPIYHVHGLFIALNTAFLMGMKIIWLDKFDVVEVIKFLPAASVMMGVPTYFTRLLGSGDFNQETSANMRLFISGSAPLLGETHEAFERRCGLRILERYGMSETGMITSNPYQPAAGRIAGSVGFALPNVEIRVADEGGQILAPDETGVLEVRGPNVFKGYWRQPEKTSAEFRDDGFFITGDLAHMDAQGRVTLVGRSKDLIISGGLNVYPKEIELVIDELDGVLESAVIGVPHNDFGEVVVAVIVPEDTDSDLDTTAVMSSLKTQIAGFKMPKTIIVLGELPRNAMGKVQKVRLREDYASLFVDTR